MTQNKIYAFLLIILTFATHPSEAQFNPDGALDSLGQYLYIKRHDSMAFSGDSMINNIFLVDYLTSMFSLQLDLNDFGKSNFYLQQGKYWVQSSSGLEMMRAYPKTGEGCCYYFRIDYAKNIIPGSKVIKRYILRSKHRSFMTESGIHLGMPIDQFLSKAHHNYFKVSKGNIESFYFCWGNLHYSCFGSYATNCPLYISEFHFQNKKLKSFGLGFYYSIPDW